MTTCDKRSGIYTRRIVGLKKWGTSLGTDASHKSRAHVPPAGVRRELTTHKRANQ